MLLLRNKDRNQKNSLPSFATQSGHDTSELQAH